MAQLLVLEDTTELVNYGCLPLFPRMKRGDIVDICGLSPRRYIYDGSKLIVLDRIDCDDIINQEFGVPEDFPIDHWFGIGIEKLYINLKEYQQEITANEIAVLNPYCDERLSWLILGNQKIYLIYDKRYQIFKRAAWRRETYPGKYYETVPTAEYTYLVAEYQD